MLNKIKRFLITRSIHSLASSHSYDEILGACNLFEMCFGRKPKSFIEVGANFFQDSQIFHRLTKCDPTNIHVIEPNSYVFNNAVTKIPNFNVYNIGISNIEGKIKLKTSGKRSANKGVSSIFERNYDPDWITGEEEIQLRRLDSVFNEEQLSNIDVIKIDVEGMTYEVLDSLGKHLHKTLMFITESELEEVYWKGQKYFYKDMVELMSKNGFVQASQKLLDNNNQFDSIWVNTNHMSKRS